MSFLKSDQIKLLKPLSDYMIPSHEGMPSASEAEVVTVWMEEILKHRHDLREAIPVILSILEEVKDQSPADQLRYLSEKDIVAAETLGYLFASSYLLNPDVRNRIGYPGQKAIVDYPAEETPYYVRNGMLQRVIDRGPIYREA